MKNNMKKSFLAMLMAILMLAIVFGTCFTVEASNDYNKNVKSIENNIETPAAGVIAGIVKNWWGGQPLEDAYVYIAGGYINLSEFDISVLVAKEQTDAEGKYRVIDVPAGRYTILVLRNGSGSLSDGWLPALRSTNVRPGETTVENFELISLSRNKPVKMFLRVPQLYLFFVYRLISLFLKQT
jgi:hypothetical protein